MARQGPYISRRGYFAKPYVEKYDDQLKCDLAKHPGNRGLFSFKRYIYLTRLPGMFRLYQLVHKNYALPYSKSTLYYLLLSSIFVYISYMLTHFVHFTDLFEIITFSPKNSKFSYIYQNSDILKFPKIYNFDRFTLSLTISEINLFVQKRKNSDFSKFPKQKILVT